MVIDAFAHRGGEWRPSDGKEVEDGFSKLRRFLKIAIISDGLIHHFPQSLKGVEIGAIGRAYA
jgi:hypothetical protein